MGYTVYSVKVLKSWTDRLNTKKTLLTCLNVSL